MFEEYRKLFPVTSQLVYLNHAAISPLSNRVTDRLEEYIDIRSFGEIESFPLADELRTETRKMLGRLINTEAEQIAFIQNTSEGFNHLVNGLQWEKGDEVILIDYEFPSNIYPFLNLEKRFGVKIKYVANKQGRVDVSDIEAAISARTKLISVSFVEFSNGFRNDLQAIGQICRTKNIIFSVDGIQGVGAIPMDVQKFNIDFLSNGGHKWLMAEMGCAFMYISKKLMQASVPAFTSWLAVENAWDFSKHQLDLLPDARRYEYASANFMGITALNASLGLLMEAGIENIEIHLRELGKVLIDGIENLGMKFCGSENVNEWSGIFSFSGKKTEELFEYLNSERIIVSLRNNNIRVAPHFYNNQQDIDTLVTAVKKFYA